MIKFYEPSGEAYFGQATITRTTSVNGGLSLTGEVFAGDDVLNGLDYGWWLNFDNEKYVITYKKLSDDTNTIVFDAVQQFFWDFAKVALHSQYSGSHTYDFYMEKLFSGSGYTYQNDATVPAFEKENWGYKNKLSLFNDIMDQADVEFEVHNETVHIAKQIGSDLTSFVRKGINLSDLTEEMKISDFATYAKGYGAFKDSDDQSKGRLEVEYRSELAKKFGDLEMDPIVDERYTVANNLIAELKKQVDATYTVSMTMNIYDLENAGYPNYESPKVGDWILAIDEALNFKRKIRIIELEEQFDVTGNRIGYTATCGDLSIIDQYTNIQSSLDSRVQSIQRSVDYVAISADGKSSNYYGAKEPTSADDGDLWFDQSNSDPDKWSIKQWANGRWEQLTLNPGEVDAKVSVAKKAADTAVENANKAVDGANDAVAKVNGIQTTVSGKADQSQVTQLAGQITSVVGDVSANSSQITQMKADINLRVKAGDVINQINISPESILIAGQKVHITGQTSIDNAVIKDAMIADIKADKITAGTLNAANVDVINLNANNITTGTIRGANLSMNLNTGEILFQKGSIRSTNGNLNIDIDDGSMAVLDGQDGFYFKNGKLSLSSDWAGNEMFGESNFGSIEYSHSLFGSSGMLVSGNGGLILGTNKYKENVFVSKVVESGISITPKGVSLQSEGTASILAGTKTTDFPIYSPPFILVGTDSYGTGVDNRIQIYAEYVHIPSAYRQTASGGPNVIVAADGALVRSTSASKYKTDIIRTNIPDYGEKLLELPTATWTDIAETKRYRDDPVNQIKPTRNFGMIAEDLADAGLEMLVVRGIDGELEGINYDRIGPALIPVIAKLKNEVETLKQKIGGKPA